MTTARVKLVAACAVAACLVAAAWVWAWPPAGGAVLANTAEGGAKAVGSATQRQPPVAQCAFKKGQLLAFRFGVKTTARSDAGLQVSVLDGEQRELDGVLHLQIDDVRGGRARAFAQVAVTNITPKKPGSGLATEPFGLEVAADCAFSHVALPPSYTTPQRNALRGLLQTLEARTSYRDAAGRWHAEHADGFGRYMVRYQGSIDDFAATRDGWHARWRDDPTVVTRLLRATLKGAFAGDGTWLQRAAGETGVELTLRLPSLTGRRIGNDSVQRVVSRVAFTVTADTAAARAVGAPAAAAWTPLHVAPEQGDASPRARVVRADDPTWAGLDRDGLLSALRAHRRTHGSHKTGLAAARIAAWLRAHPDGAAALIAAMRDGSIEEALRPVLFLGLQKAGTPEAHAALADVANDPQMHPPDRFRAIAALAEFAKPNAETLQVLTGLARADNDSWSELENTAVYGIGVLASHTAANAPDVAAAAKADLQDRLKTPSGLRELDAALEAVGNAGSADLLPHVQPHLHDEQSAVRIAALQALRLMPPSATEELFGTLIDQATSAAETVTVLTVFRQAAFHHETPPPAAVLTRAIGELGKDSGPAVAKSLVELIGASDDSAAHAALVAAMRKEKDADVLVVYGRFVAAEEIL